MRSQGDLIMTFDDSWWLWKYIDLKELLIHHSIGLTTFLRPHLRASSRRPADFLCKSTLQNKMRSPAAHSRASKIRLSPIVLFALFLRIGFINVPIHLSPQILCIRRMYHYGFILRNRSKAKAIQCSLMFVCTWRCEGLDLERRGFGGGACVEVPYTSWPNTGASIFGSHSKVTIKACKACVHPIAPSNGHIDSGDIGEELRCPWLYSIVNGIV